MKKRSLQNLFSMHHLVLSFQWLVLIFLSQTALRMILSNIDADFLYVSLFARDFVAGHDLIGWKVTPSPYFFPDIFLHLATELLGEYSFGAGALVYYVFSIILFIVGAHIIFRKLGFEREKTCLVAGSLGVLVVLNLVAQGQPQFSKWFLRAGMHGSAASVAVFGLASMLLIISKNKMQHFVFLRIIIGSLLMVSDLLFANQFLIPGVLAALLVSVFAKGNRSLFFRMALEMIAVLALGFILTEYLKSFVNFDFTLIEQTTQLTFSVSWERLLANLVVMSESPNIFSGLTVLGLVLLTLGFLFSLFQLAKKTNTQNKDFVRLFFYAFTLASIVGSVLPSLLFGYYMDFNSLRYLIPVFLYSLLAFGLWVLSLNSYFRVNVGMIFSVSVLCLAAFQIDWKNIHGTKSILATDVPDSIQCLDRLATKNHWKKGLSDYWNAKPIIYWSKSNLAIGQVSGNLDVYYWISKLDDFFKHSGSGEPISFDFIMMNNLNPMRVFWVLRSPPKAIHKCGDSIIWELDTKQRLIVGDHIRKQLISKYSAYLAQRPESFSNWLF